MINASFTSQCIANGFGEGENCIATAMESAIEKIKVQKIPSPISELSVYLSDGEGYLANSDNVKGNQALMTLTVA